MLLWVALAAAAPAWAQSRNLAPGFEQLPAGQRVVLMPVDVELFSLSAGGVAEPKADWTASAQQHMNAELRKRIADLKLDFTALADNDADDFAELIALHVAVARSINLHHGVADN
jgi:hypothetical protein